MNAKPTSAKTPDDAVLLQSRLALRVCAHLHEAAGQVPPDISERLRFARQVALERAAALSAKTAALPHAAGVGVASLGLRGALAGGSQGSGEDAGGVWASWLTAGLTAMVLALGLAWIEFRHSSHEIEATAEVDAALLADDLPPEAYTDRAFLEFLREPLPSPETHSDG
jgi:hypothetical protein